MGNGRVRQFVLFTAPTKGARKDFVVSFASREEAVAAGEKLKSRCISRWQVIDNSASEVVAEDPGTSIDPNPCTSPDLILK